MFIYFQLNCRQTFLPAVVNKNIICLFEPFLNEDAKCLAKRKFLQNKNGLGFSDKVLLINNMLYICLGWWVIFISNQSLL